MQEIQWTLYRFDQLPSELLYDVIKLRIDVFVVEQTCPYPELDNLDKHPDVYHLVGELNGEIAAYARLLPPGCSYDHASIGRVIIAPQARGLGIGHQLIETALDYQFDQCHYPSLTIGAQAHLSDFYQQHGFEIISEPYLEDNILHVKMHLSSEDRQ